MRREMEEGDITRNITVSIKFAGRLIPITLSLESTVKDLKSLIQPLTNVLPRGQKLLHKGKILVDNLTLKSSFIENGSKIMLIASQGLHQGSAPIRKEALASSNSRTTAEADGGSRENTNTSVGKSQVDRWRVTRVVALSESNLKAIPDEVWKCGPSARVLDLSHNNLQDVPAAIGCMSSMQKLLLNANELSVESINWEGLTSVKSLTALSLDQNRLTTLPSALGALICLRQLNVANNMLRCLPDEIGLLTELQVLKLNNNRISTIPASIGNCTSLVEVDLSSNHLVELPETFRNLQNLVILRLSNNGLKSLPSTLFKMCIQLSTLDLHSTEITMELLRQLEGWEDFDKRRLSKQQKQLDFRVEGSSSFDEGADKGW